MEVGQRWRARIHVGRPETCPRCCLSVWRGDEVLDVVAPGWLGTISIHATCRRPADRQADGPPAPGVDVCRYCEGQVDIAPWWNDLGELCHEGCALLAERI